MPPFRPQAADRDPQDEAAAVASEAIQDVLISDRVLREVRLVFLRERDAQVFLAHQRFERT